MTEIIFLIIGIFFFALTLGVIVGELLSDLNRKRAEVKITEEPEEESDEKDDESLHRPYGNGPHPFDKGGNDLDPMALRNGYGVTRDRNPTFAEQWVNIMNYNGECQTEGDYEETGNNPADDLE